MRKRFGRPFFEGWEEIGEALGKHPSTVRVYAALEKDPLPVQRDKLSNRVWVYESTLNEWAEMQGAIPIRPRPPSEDEHRYRKDRPRPSTMPMTLTSRPPLEEVYKWILPREIINPKLRFRILSRDKYRCRYCGAEATDQDVKLEVDHIIPVVRGGSDDEENLITACDKCNSGKSDVHPDAPLGKYAKMPIGCRR